MCMEKAEGFFLRFKHCKLFCGPALGAWRTAPFRFEAFVDHHVSFFSMKESQHVTNLHSRH